MDLIHESSSYGERLTFTTRIVQKARTRGEYWKVMGDLDSGRYSTEFILYRHMNSQFHELARKQSEPPERDVLWSDTKDISYLDSQGSHIFFEKTQGRPYHLAVLAVAMLIEGRFPDRAFMAGDLQPIQVHKMLDWCNERLEQPISMPICYDAERLYRRLKLVYDDPALLYKRFQALFQGQKAEATRILYQADRKAYLANMRSDFSSYYSIGQYGAGELARTFLEAGGELDTLIETVQAVAAGPHQAPPASRGQESSQTEQDSDDFDLALLLEQLCRRYVSIDPQELRVLEEISAPEELMPDITDYMNEVFKRLTGFRKAMKLYIPSDKLLEVFCAHEPGGRTRFKTTLDREEAECRNNLAQIRQARQKLKEKHPELQSEVESQPPDGPGNHNAAKQDISPEDYIHLQAENQRYWPADAPELVGTVGKTLREKLEKNPDLGSKIDKVTLLRLLCLASMKNGIPLSESSWKALEEHTEMETLRCLALLASFESQELTFWEMRLFVFAHPQRWDEWMKG
jgi:hypothetical protein